MTADTGFERVDSLWLLASDVTSWMQQSGQVVDDATALQMACNAAAEWLEGKRRRSPRAFDDFDEDGQFVPGGDTLLGAVMLAARLYMRRGAMLGTTGYTDLNVGQVMRSDPDIARLLRLGNYGPFIFGAPTDREAGDG